MNNKKAKDIMTTDVKVAKQTDTIKSIAKILIHEKIGGLPVVDEDNRVVGIISETDIIAFVENIFRDVARKLDIPAKKLLPIIQDENNAFFSIKSEIFEKYAGLGKFSDEFEELKTLLRIPDVSFLDKGEGMVDIIIERCSELSDEDKEKVVDTLNSQIKKNFRLDTQKLIEYFNNLPDIEKFNVMKYLGAFEVKVEIIPR